MVSYFVSHKILLYMILVLSYRLISQMAVFNFRIVSKCENCVASKNVVVSESCENCVRSKNSIMSKSCNNCVWSKNSMVI